MLKVGKKCKTAALMLFKKKNAKTKTKQGRKMC